MVRYIDTLSLGDSLQHNLEAENTNSAEQHKEVRPIKKIDVRQNPSLSITWLSQGHSSEGGIVLLGDMVAIDVVDIVFVEFPISAAWAATLRNMATVIAAPVRELTEEF